MTTPLDAANFEQEVLHSELPVLVDFFTEQCGPCKQLAPVLDQLAVEFEGRARIFKIDAFANLPLATRYGVRSVPNLLFFRHGEVREQLVGLIKHDELRARLEALA